MKKTALFNIHSESGAKLVPFAGYSMPLQYTGVNAEHLAVRTSAGVFDVSHMGEFILRGDKAEYLLQQLTANDVSKLTKGQVQYSYIPNDKGGVVDDILLYKLEKQSFMIVVNASNIEKDWSWINKHNNYISSGGSTNNCSDYQNAIPTIEAPIKTKKAIEIINISDQTTLLAVQGPNAGKILQKLTDIDLMEMKYYTFKKATFSGVDHVLISATGYTGSGGFELYFANEHATHIWNAIFEAGKEYDIVPCGLAARDTLRLEMGYCLYGNEINETTSPLEAGLGWVTKFNKDFIAHTILLKQKQEGITNKLVAFEMLDKGIPRHDYKITDENGNEIGMVTSGTMSPSLKQGIGLGYIKKAYMENHKLFYVRVRDRLLKAQVCKLPFYKNGIKK